MPVCVICEGDGVIDVRGAWYCKLHVRAAFLDVAAFLARSEGWDEDETRIQLIEWMTQE